MRSRPALLPAWRLEPNLTGQVAIADASLSILGVRLNVSNEVKPLLDRAVNEQIAALQARLRDDPFLELAARREWAKMCRSIPLGARCRHAQSLARAAPDAGLCRAAAHRRLRGHAPSSACRRETRIVPNETKPDCPFPAQLELVPQTEQGRVNIAVPIDIPFTEVNRLLAAQLTGKTFPEDKAAHSPSRCATRMSRLPATGC